MRIKIEQPKLNIKAGVAKITPSAESLEITPSKDAQSYQGLYDNVSVSGDNNLTAENIKKDVSIFGVEGNYEPEIKLQNKNVSITENGTQTISADNGYDGLQEVDVTVNVGGGYNVGGVYNAEIDGSLAYDLSFGIRSLIKDIKNLDVSNITNMTGMFNGCSNLRGVSLIATGSVTNMSSMFSNCYSLTTIPLLDTSSVTNMNNMFYNCKGLTTIPLLDTSSVKNMSYMFVNCSNLTTIPLLDTSSVTNMNNMFVNCSNLTTIESLNNVLEMCINATSYTRTKTLALIGLSKSQTETCMTLPNYQAFLDAGWTTGY